MLLYFNCLVYYNAQLVRSSFAVGEPMYPGNDYLCSLLSLREISHSVVPALNMFLFFFY